MLDLFVDVPNGEPEKNEGAINLTGHYEVDTVIRGFDRLKKSRLASIECDRRH